MNCTYEFVVPGGTVELTVPASAALESEFTIDSFIKDLTAFMSKTPDAKEQFKALLENIANAKNRDAQELSALDTKVVFERMQEHLKQLGVEIILTDTMPMQEYDNARACVYNGKIFINTRLASVSDPMHEMLHLVLGVLKVDNYSSFQKLLDNLLLLPAAKVIFDNYLGEEYAHLMYYDKLEEVFVKLISEVLEGQYNLEENKELSSFLDQASEVLTPHINKTFGIEVSDGLINFLQSPLKDLTKKGSTLFIKKTYRTTGYSENKKKVIESQRITQYIKDLIEDGIIKEECE